MLSITLTCDLGLGRLPQEGLALERFGTIVLNCRFISFALWVSLLQLLSERLHAEDIKVNRGLPLHIVCTRSAACRVSPDVLGATRNKFETLASKDVPIRAA